MGLPDVFQCWFLRASAKTRYYTQQRPLTAAGQALLALLPHARDHQTPLRPVNVMPVMIRRWKAKNTSRSGNAVTLAPAAIRPYSIEN